MINLPSFEMQGIVPCWKKVTCTMEIRFNKIEKANKRLLQAKAKKS